MKSEDVIRGLIQDKLSRGELPGDDCSKVLGGTSNGEICDACGDPIVSPQLVMEGYRNFGFEEAFLCSVLAILWQ